MYDIRKVLFLYTITPWYYSCVCQVRHVAECAGDALLPYRDDLAAAIDMALHFEERPGNNDHNNTTTTTTTKTTSTTTIQLFTVNQQQRLLLLLLLLLL